MGIPNWVSVRTKQWVEQLARDRHMREWMEYLPVINMRGIGNVEQDMIINDMLLPKHLTSRKWPKTHAWALDETRLRNLIRYLD